MSKFLSGRERELKVGIVSYTENNTVLRVVGNTNVTGIVTATGGFNLGISSAGTSITSGPVTRLNFIGAGNTFAVNGTTVDVSIAGGGSGGGASVSISTTPPTSPNEGDLWYSSILGRTFIYYTDEDSSQWVDAAPFNIPEPLSTPGKSSATITATEGQTAFSVSYTAGYIDVFLNGIRLNSTEYIAADESTITLLQGATAGDILDVVEYRMGIGDTGPQGLPGPLSGVTSITTNGTYYPVIVSGVGNVDPYISITSNYFSVNPSSGTLTTNQLNVVGATTVSSLIASQVNVSGVCTALDFNSTSDKILKDNIQRISNSIEKILQINGVTFDWKDTHQSSAGVIAQDVEKVFPEVVKTSDHKTVNYNGLIGLMVEAIKEQQEQINTLTKRIEELEGL